MITVSIFVISLIFLGLLFFVKKRELAGGSMILPGVRSRADVAVVRISERFELAIQHFFHMFSKKVIIKGFHNITLAALRVVRMLERRLVRMTTLVRGRHESLIRRSSVTSYLEGLTREHREEEEKN